MSREFKNLPFTNIKSESEGRIRKGIAAVFGNIDDWNDRIQPGAFKKTIAEGLKRVRHLWNHDSRTPPIATIKEMRELSRDDLPDEVLEKSPDATGGLLVAREYYKNDLSSWVLEAIDKGDVNEMSFAFEIINSDVTTEEIEGTEETRKIRELRELRVFDTSDVNWGMNSATVAAGAKSNIEPLPLGLVYSNFLAIQDQLKEGRRNSDSDQKLIDLIHETACNLGATCESKSDDAPDESGKNQSDNDTEDDKAGAVENDTPLSSLGLKIQSLEIENLTN